MLPRWVQKGAVAAAEGDRKFLYSARVTREALARREAKGFLARVFDGAVAPALVHFMQDAKLSPQQIQELKKILDREARHESRHESRHDSRNERAADRR